LTKGPVVVSFYRGDWCDYCAMELAALAAIHEEVKRLGASLIAISPQRDESRIRSADIEPPFPLLTDVDAKLARRCGIAYPPFEELRPIYANAGRKPPPEGPDNWLLPLPATYVIDWTGTIVLSFLDPDYTSRLEPAEIMAILAHLARRMEQERPRSTRGPKAAARRRGPIPRRNDHSLPTRTS
jgi:peroxiredoxin